MYFIRKDGGNPDDDLIKKKEKKRKDVNQRAGPGQGRYIPLIIRNSSGNELV